MNRSSRTNTSVEENPRAVTDSSALPALTLGNLEMTRLWKQQKSSVERPQATPEDARMSLFPAVRTVPSPLFSSTMHDNFKGQGKTEK